MTTMALDCETVCDLSGVDEADVLTLVDAANKRDQHIEQFVATAPPLARVVLVGLLNPDTGGRCVVYDAGLLDVDETASELTGVRLLPAGGEAALLAIAHDVIGKASRLVTFNGRSFDLPLLLLRAVRHGISTAQIVRRAVYQKPWEDGAHLDVLSLLTFGGATGKYPLAAYSIAMGVGNPKQHGDGSNVGELVKARNGTALAGYCLGDVAATVALAIKAGAITTAAPGRQRDVL